MDNLNRTIHSPVGQVFGRLSVLTPATKGEWGHNRWLCRCECGKETIVGISDLKSGNTKSCGCLLIDILVARNKSLEIVRRNVKHRLSGTPEYYIWYHILRRCNNPKAKDFPRYGGRGITVCERWYNHVLFLKDMGPRPAPGMQIDRINNSKGYEPGNCRWVTPKEQANNRRNTRYLTFLGTTKTISEWTEITGIPYYLIFQRMKKSTWPVEKILSSHRYNSSRSK